MVLHTLTKGSLPLGLKGRFYAIVAFVYLIGIFYAKQMMENPMHTSTYRLLHKGKFLRHIPFMLYIIT